MAAPQPSKPNTTTGEFDGPEMAKWLAENGFTGNKLVKVLVLGNSGSGKSFLCNALVGDNTFEHKTTAISVTSKNTFVAAVIGDVAFVICNIPGLIEADQDNIKRNKAAIEAAFNFQPGCPTLALFVASAVGGRIKNEDYQAILALKKYVELDAVATAFVLNGVNWEEIDDEADVYRAKVEQQVHIIVDKAMTVTFCEKVGKAQKSDYTCEAMLKLQATLVACLQQHKPVAMVPAEGAELVLEHEQLKKDFEQLKKQVADQEEAHRQAIAQQNAAWQAEIAASEQRHQAKMAEMQATMEALRNRPPQVIYQGGGGGCFSEGSATVLLAATRDIVKMASLQIGDEILGFDRRTLKPQPTRVLLIDRHPKQSTAMLVITTSAGHRIEMTPEHLLWVRRAGSSSTVVMAQASVVASKDEVAIASSSGVLEWQCVESVSRTIATPINVYTANGTMLVCGVGASCYAVNEWWGWADMLPTRLLAWVSPTLPAHPVYERVRAISDRITDGVLYRVNGWMPSFSRR